MASIGFHPNLPAHGSCGGVNQAAYPAPAPGKVAAGGFAIPMDMGAMGAPDFGDERFLPTMGGVILDRSGAPAGRIPEGSFLDRSTGNVHGPDGKAIALPEGATVDLFDLPDIRQLLTGAAGGGSGATAPVKGEVAGARGSGASDAPAKTAVDGQWGPGGVTDLKAGAAGSDSRVGGASGGGVAQAEGCDDAHGGPSGPSGPKGTRAGGPSSPGSLQSQLQQGLEQLAAMGVRTGPPSLPTRLNPHVLGGGMSGAVLGANGLGSIPSLQLSLMELVRTLDQLARALQQAAPVGGGAPPSKDTAVGGATGSGSTTSPKDAPAKAVEPSSATAGSSSSSTPVSEATTPSSAAGAAGAGAPASTGAATSGSSTPDEASSPSSSSSST